MNIALSGNYNYIQFEYLDTFDNKIAEDERIFQKNYNDLESGIYQKEIENYKIVSAPEKIDALNKKYQFIYSKKVTVNIEYLNIETNEKIYENGKIDAFIGDILNVDAMEIEGYTYENGGKDEKIDNEDKIIKICYRKKIVTTNNRSTHRRNREVPINNNDVKQEIYYEMNVFYKEFDTDKILFTDKVKYKEGTKNIRYKIKRIEGYKIMDDEDKSIINEILNGLNNNANESKARQPKKKNNVKEEYEIVMNCDKSDYIIYFKK